MEKTLRQFDEIMAGCKRILMAKQRDYGSSWRIMRPSSLTDQLYIKAKRIREIEEKGLQLVDDPVEGEYMGLVNYSLLALIQLSMPPDAPLELPDAEVEARYEAVVGQTRELLKRKNHDYGEVWREMRVSSMTDLILAKLLRIKQIEDNDGRTLLSEGVEGNYFDIINYAIFALIKLHEAKAEKTS